MNVHVVESTEIIAPRVRVAVPADLQQLLEMGYELHRENGLVSASELKIEAAAHRAIEGKDGVAGVIGPVGALQAMIYLVIGQYWYSDDLHLEELCNYVRPEFRKSGNAKALIGFAKKCAKNMKLPLLIGVVSNQRTSEKVRLYRRQLGFPAGAYFLYNSKTGE